jgi:hypothetical protein
LRYLIEFFGELLPSDETEHIEKQLRRLQPAWACLTTTRFSGARCSTIGQKRKTGGNQRTRACRWGIALLNEGQQTEAA